MNFLELFASQIGQDKVDQMAASVGGDKNQAMAAIGQAVPLLVSAMARNTKTEEGANALSNALDRDHDGSILGNLPELFSNPAIAKGEGILGHVLGTKREVAQTAVSQSSGLSSEATSKVFQMVAPMVLGMIGAKKKQEGFGANILASMLNNFSQTHESQNQAPQQQMGGDLLGSLAGMMMVGGASSNSSGNTGGGIGNLITSILDRDGDGSVMDDVAGMVGGMLGGKK